LSYRKLYLSSRNWLRLMLKNYSAGTILRGLPTYFAFEFTVRLLGLVWVSRRLQFAFLPLHSLLWNVAHFGDTLQARRLVQSARSVSDLTVLRAMGPAGLEPLGHLLRRARVPKEAELAKRVGGRL